MDHEDELGVIKSEIANMVPTTKVSVNVKNDQDDTLPLEGRHKYLVDSDVC